MCRICMRTSCACGGATSTSSIFSSSPAPQHTAALQVIVFPTVSDMLVEMVGDEGKEEKRQKARAMGRIL